MDHTCHHYDSMHQGNIEAAKKVWNFLRISTKCEFITDAPLQFALAAYIIALFPVYHR